MAAGELPYMHSPVVGIQSFLTVALSKDWGIVFTEDRYVNLVLSAFLFRPFKLYTKIGQKSKP